MAAVANNPAFAKKVGIPQSVGKDFSEADKGKKFKGGGMAHDDILEDKKLIKRAFKMHDAQEHKGKHTDLAKLKRGGTMKMAKGGKVTEKRMEPATMKEDVEKGSNKLLKHGESAVQKRGHTKGKNLGDTGPSIGIEGGAKKMCKGGKAMKYAKGGFVRSADGIASKGKTKGKLC